MFITAATSKPQAVPFFVLHDARIYFRLVLTVGKQLRLFVSICHPLHIWPWARSYRIGQVTIIVGRFTWRKIITNWGPVKVGFFHSTSSAADKTFFCTVITVLWRKRRKLPNRDGCGLPQLSSGEFYSRMNLPAFVIVEVWLWFCAKALWLHIVTLEGPSEHFSSWSFHF